MIPAGSLRERFGAVHREAGELNDIAALFLARTFGVSLKALRSRLEALKLVSRDKLVKLDAAILEANSSRPELEATLSLPDQPRWEALPERYVFLALRAHKEGLIDRGRLAEFLGTNENDTALRLLQYLASVRDISGPSEPSEPSELDGLTGAAR